MSAKCLVMALNIKYPCNTTIIILRGCVLCQEQLLGKFDKAIKSVRNKISSTVSVKNGASMIFNIHKGKIYRFFYKPRKKKISVTVLI